MDRLADLAYLCFGLGFFTWSMWYVSHRSDVEYDRKLNERREFGYANGTKYHPFRKKPPAED